jgi:hypothetical protein
MPTLSTIYTAKPTAQDAKTITLAHTTASISNQASATYDFVISNMSQLLEISSDVDCRVILYGSSAGRAADTRAYNDYNNDNSIVNDTKLLFDVVLTAGTQSINNVFLSNREGSNRSTIYAKIFNLSGASSTVQVSLKAVQFGFENDFHLINVQTTDCTANDGEHIPCDTSGGAFTVTTPASGRFKVIDVAGNASTEGFGANNLTIEAAAGTTIMGDAVLNLDVGAISPEFQLIGTDWRITNSNYGGVVDSAPPVVTREVLTADITYYVDATTGLDTNDGLSTISAFQTIGKALDMLQTFDGNGGVATVNINGTFDENVNINGYKYVGYSSIALIGDTANPSNAFINCSSGTAIVVNNKINVTVSGLKLAAASGNAIDCGDHARVSISLVDFSTCSSFHLQFVRSAHLNIIGDYTISGSAQHHYRIYHHSYVTGVGKTITVLNNPTFSFFASVFYCGVLDFWSANTFTGSATGARYSVQWNGVIRNAGGTSNFPGNAAGTVTTGGQYTT